MTTARHDGMPRHDDPTNIEPQPQPPPMRGPGATGEKVAMLDPAMSPLGTDDEAAGAPPTPEMVQAVREAELMANPPPGDPGKRSGIGLGPKLLAVLIFAVALGHGAVWLG